MTGPEHFRHAEILLNPGGQGADDRDIALAQVHALLALAAATALGTEGAPADDYGEWVRAASEQPAAAQRRREADRAEFEPEWDSIDSNAYQDRLEAEGGAS